ncbi:MAG: hypothetical protein RJB38_1011 [Pseudomonadota bacterium]|jgi:Tfp pilus assembly protein PilF
MRKRVPANGGGVEEASGGVGCGRFLALSLVAALGGLLTPFRALASPPGLAVEAWRVRPEDRGEQLLHLKKIWEKDPSSASVAVDLSSLMLLQGRREEACRTLLSSYALTSREADRARLRERVRVISRVFQTGEGARNYHAGLQALTGGDFSAALVRFERVLSEENQVLDALVRKAQIELLRGHVDLATETFRTAYRLNPFEPELRFWLGHLMMSRGERSEGMRELLAAWEGFSPEQKRRPHLRAWLSEGLWRSGQSAAAKKWISWTQIRNPEEWSDRTGWEILAALHHSPALEGEARRFLNLFPKSYQRLVGDSGLDLEWWSSALLESRSSLEGFSSSKK